MIAFKDFEAGNVDICLERNKGGFSELRAIPVTVGKGAGGK
jgi:hypothetical protein